MSYRRGAWMLAADRPTTSFWKDTMKNRIPRRITPSMVVALTALVFAMSGAGYAATQLGGPTAKAAKKKKARRGPAGPQGAAGAPGAPGAPGVAGSPGAITFSGRINTLNTAVGTASGSPNGTSTAGGGNFFLSPNASLTAKSLAVKVTNPPGTTSLRFFHVTINGTDTAAGCVVLSGGDTCTIALDDPIPPASLLAISSEVVGAAAAPADAVFAWTAQ
jgi:hypothetical protein